MKDDLKPETQNPKPRRTPRRPEGAWLTEEEARLVNETLGGMSAENPVVRAMDLLLAAVGAMAVATALDPAWTPEQRQYWAGRAGMVPDMRSTLQSAFRGELVGSVK